MSYARPQDRIIRPQDRIIPGRGQRRHPTPSIFPGSSVTSAHALPDRSPRSGRFFGSSSAYARRAVTHVEAPEPACLSDETIMTMLKRMRPEELREVSKAATALEKTKLEERRRKKIKAEEKKKVDAFVAKNDNLFDLVGDCYICLDPLLNNIGTTKFGVLSWRCRCTVAQKAHSACVFSKFCHGQGKCDMCHSPMKVEKTRRRGLETAIQFHRDVVRADADDISSGNSSAGEDDGDDDGDDGARDDNVGEEQGEVDEGLGDDNAHDDIVGGGQGGVEEALGGNNA